MDRQGGDESPHSQGAGRDPPPVERSARYCFFSSGILLPSVAQPPLPLQEFLPLQPLSPDLQPPLPLQEFWPLQACFSFTLESAFLSVSCGAEKEALALVRTVEACTAAPVPASKPAIAALVMRALVVFVMGK